MTMHPSPIRKLFTSLVAACSMLVASGFLFAHSSRDSLNWDRTYIGTMQCVGGCPKCTVAVTLSQDGTFEVRCAAEADCCTTPPLVGRFQWDSDGQRIVLDVGKATLPAHFFVGEDFLETVNAEGTRDGLAILRKEPAKTE